jgi:hypothetical protein
LATRVYDTREFELQDGTVVEVKPLNIKRLRKFMAVVQDIQNVADDDQEGQLNSMLAACAVVLDGKVAVPDGDAPYETRLLDVLSELLDLPTMNQIMEVAGGITVGGSPNPALG